MYKEKLFEYNIICEYYFNIEFVIKLRKEVFDLLYSKQRDICVVDYSVSKDTLI